MIKLYARPYLSPAQAQFGFGKSLLTNRGIAGKASRFGYKKIKKGIRAGKAFKAGVTNRIKNSRTIARGLKSVERGVSSLSNRFTNRN
jgi:hypothetical protein